MSQEPYDEMGGPSAWARQRFGEHAAPLTRAVPERLTKAHLRAQAGHLATGLKKRGPYGHSLAEAVLEELAEEALTLGGAVRELRGRPYAVVSDHALFPFRYAPTPVPLERARLRSDASRHKLRMLTAHSPQVDALFPVDDAMATEEYEELHQTFEELGRATTLVSVFFTSDVEHGIHSIYWGDAHLEPDRTFTWSYNEFLGPVTGGHQTGL